MPFCLAAMLAVLQAGAAAGREMPLLSLPQGSVQQDLPESAMNGVRLQVRVLDIAGPIHEVLDDIALQFDPPLQALQHGEGWILVDTAAPGRMVMLSPRSPRTFGVVSSLSGTAAGMSRRPDLPSWLPAGTVQRMTLESDDGRRISTQRVFTHPSLSSGQLARQVFARLAGTGWISTGRTQAASSTWVHDSTEMSLSIVPAAQGSGLMSVMTSPVASWPGSREHVRKR